VATSEVLNDTATGGGLAAADLRSGSVGTAEVVGNAVTSGKIANGQVKRGDLDSAAITGGITQVVGASQTTRRGSRRSKSRVRRARKS
jgi:hypothetical protein